VGNIVFRVIGAQVNLLGPNHFTEGREDIHPK